MRPAVVLAICALSVLLLPPARGSEPLAAVDVAAARDLVRSGGHRYLDVRLLGFENVKNMKGGFILWAENGFAVKKPEVKEEL
ncbi:hypothetical protein EJB05_40389, partial [Eragrostis curvula]